MEAIESGQKIDRELADWKDIKMRGEREVRNHTRNSNYYRGVLSNIMKRGSDEDVTVLIHKAGLHHRGKVAVVLSRVVGGEVEELLSVRLTVPNTGE
jgi:hypothetical protein